jgi:ATP-binding cassette, subfamily B, multidrug efflux pump
MKSFKTLAKSMKGCWGLTIVTWVLVTLETICEGLVPFLLQFLIDSIGVDMSKVYFYGAIAAAFGVCSAILGVLAGYCAATASMRFSRNLRHDLYYKLQDFSFSNIDKFSISSLVTRLTTDVNNVQDAFQMTIRSAIRAPLMMIFSLVMCFVTQWRLAWIFAIIVPLVLFLLIFLANKVHPLFVRVFNEYDELNKTVGEDLNGIRVVKSFNREGEEKKKFSFVSNIIYKYFGDAEKIIAWNSPVLMFSVYASMLAIAYLGARLIVSDEMTTGQLTSLISYVMLIMMSLMMLSMIYVFIIISRNSAERISEVLVEVPSIVSPINPITEVKDGSVDFNHVNFRYSATAGKDVLHDIDIHVPSGATVGLIGSTGSSKSTLISLIARLYDVQDGEGSVAIGGHNVKEYDLKALRDAVAVVLQKNTLFTGTIKDNLRWGNENATDEEIARAAAMAQAADFIESSPNKYDTLLDQGGTNVSGGQKQRLCIARALLKNPKILILDDSTSAIDTHTDALIRQTFKNDLPGMTKFIIAQRILSIRDCDMIFVLDDGKLVAQGTDKELLASCSIYQELCQSQLGGGDFDVQ